MVLSRIIRSRLLYTVFTHQNNLPILKTPLNPCFSVVQDCSSSRANVFSAFSIFQRMLSASALVEERIETDSIDSDSDESMEKPENAIEKTNFVLKKQRRSKKGKKKGLDDVFKEETDSIDSDSDESMEKPENAIEKTNFVLKKRRSKKGKKKGLADVFKEAVGLIEKVEESETTEEESKEGEFSGDSRLKEIIELKKKLRKLESEVRSVKVTEEKHKEMEKKDGTGTPEVQSKPVSLYTIFTNNSNKRLKSAVSEKENKPHIIRKKRDKPRLKDEEDKPRLKSEEDQPRLKELSPEMTSLVTRFYEEGYLNNANFLPKKKLDLSRFSNHYSRYFLKFAAERFAKDKQEIAKWLSGSELKKVALFGCPSVDRKTVFAAKRLRAFFSIQEDIVCRACELKSSCKLVNRGVSKVKNLNLADVIGVLIFYGMDLFPPELNVPDEIKTSVSKLLKEVNNLSQLAPSSRSLNLSFSDASSRCGGT